MDKAGETLEHEGTRKAGENARCRADGQRQKHHFRGALKFGSSAVRRSNAASASAENTYHERVNRYK
jgi:hypothetical protein